MRISCLQSKLQLGVVYHRSCCTYLNGAVESRFEILSFIWLWIWLIACVSPNVELKIIQRINQRVARPNGNEACQRLSIARAREIHWSWDTLWAWPGLACLLSRNVKLRITRTITPLGIESLTRCIIFQLPSESRLMLPRT